MKKNLFLTVVIAITALTFFGCQDPIKDLTITQTPGTAPEVAADSINAKAVVLADGTSEILVSWTDAENNGSYYVYRRDIDEEGNPVGNGTLIAQGNSIQRTATKKIPYYEDDEVKAGASYQYGIVNRSYKSGTDVIELSDIVWQDVGEGTYAKALAAPTTVTLVDTNPKAPTVTLTPVTTTTYYKDYIENIYGSGYKQNPDYLAVKVEGLTYGYNYSFTVNYSPDTANATSAWQSDTPVSWSNGSPSFSDNAFIEQTLGEDAPVFYGSIQIGGAHDGSSGALKEGKRIKVQYSTPPTYTTQLKVSVLDPQNAGVIKSGINRSNIEVLEQYTY